MKEIEKQGNHWRDKRIKKGRGKIGYPFPIKGVLFHPGQSFKNYLRSYNNSNVVLFIWFLSYVWGQDGLLLS